MSMLFAYLFLALLAMIFSFLSVRYAGVRVRKSPGMIAGMVFFCIGVLWSIGEQRQFLDIWQTRTWPATQGSVISSTVIGERAFRPMVIYQYRVNRFLYQDTTDLNMPGFGGRINRLDAAEKKAQQYQPGDTVRVYYHPQKPGIALLYTGPSFSDYLRLGTSMIVFAVGIILMTISILSGHSPNES